MEETSASNTTASIVAIVLYLLAIFTLLRILLGANRKLHKKMVRVMDVPVVGPVIYWLYIALSGKKKPKHHHHSK